MSWAVARVASILVPRGERADWLREWRGELWHRAHASHAGGGWSLIRAASGSFAHALTIGLHEWRRLLSGQDLCYALRSLRRSPGFTTVCVVTLAVGIGATTAIYTLVDGVLLAPLPYPGGDRLFRVDTRIDAFDFSGLPSTHALYLSLRERLRTADALEAYAEESAVLTDGAEPMAIGVAHISEGLLSMLGVGAAAGRTFDNADHSPGAARVALLSYGLWVDRYGGDRGVIGRTVRVSDVPHEVIGVLPPRFALLPEVDVWMPLVYAPDYARAGIGDLLVLGRRAAGVEFDALLRDLSSAFDAARAAYPAALRPFGVEVRDYRDTLISGGARRNLLLLLGAVAAVLLIACVNVANLFMARGETREHELAVRASLGAGRIRLARQVLTEGMVIAFAGGATGLALAYLSVNRLLAMLPESIPRRAEIGVDWRVAGAALLLTAGTGLLFALWPAVKGSAKASVSSLGEARRATASRRSRRTGNALLVLEVSQAMILLVAGGLLVNTLLRMQHAEAGFELDDLYAVHLTLPPHRYSSEESGLAFGRQALDRLQTLPGVDDAGLASSTPFTGHTAIVGLEPEGGIRGDGVTGLNVVSPGLEATAWSSYVAFAPGYLSALGLRLLYGRAPAAADALPEARSVWVDEAFARGFFGVGNPVGLRVRYSGRDDDAWLTIAGVVTSLTHPGLPDAGMAELYVPYGSAGDSELSSEKVNLVLRSSAAPADLVPLVRSVLWDIDPDLPIPIVAPAMDLMAHGLASARFYALLLFLFALIGLLLAAVGIYGVASYSAARRAREMGIRLAIGATGARIVATMLREGGGVLGLGLVLGCAGALAASRLLRQLLYDVRPGDPATYLAVAAVLGLAGLIALWIPARRAALTDPLTTLREG